MKKRICFVGFANDEPRELELLKHAIAGISGAWDCVFVSDGPAALAAMATEPFDAVVTKMHPGGMNAAELLQQVGSRYPKTLGFVLGDVRDRELVIHCLGGTHQFIAQPYNPRALISIIQRSLDFDGCRAPQASEKKATTKIMPTHAEPKPGPPLARARPVPPPVPTVTRAPATAPRNHRLRWMLIPTSVAVCIAAIWFWQPFRSDPGTYIRARARTTTDSIPADLVPVLIPHTKPIAAPAPPAPPTNATIPATITAPTSAFESVKVQAIFYRAPNPSVMINGRTLNVGERINGLEVVAIERASVTLASANERKVFRFK